MPRYVTIDLPGPFANRALLLLPSGLTALTLRARLCAPAWFLLRAASLSPIDGSPPLVLSADDIFDLAHNPQLSTRLWHTQFQPAALCPAPHDPQIRPFAPARLTLTRRLISRPSRFTAILTLFFRALPPTSPRHPLVLLARLRRAARCRRPQNASPPLGRFPQPPAVNP
jgi:hypothetical protein